VPSCRIKSDRIGVVTFVATLVMAMAGCTTGAESSPPQLPETLAGTEALSKDPETMSDAKVLAEREQSLRYVEVNGVRFAYLEEGEGPLILFLHGFPDNAWSYRRQLRAFADAGYRAVAPFMRGYAPTAIPADGKYDPRTLASDIEGLIAALSPNGRASVVGMDWGGTALFTALVAAPASIDAAVVMATPHPVTYLAIRKDPEALQSMFHLYYFQTPGAADDVGIAGLPFVDYLWRTWSPSFQDKAHVESVKETLGAPGSLKAALSYYPAIFAAAAAGQIPVGEIKTPTLTIYGASDVSGKYSSLEAPFFKGPYQRIVLPDVGHFPHLEREQDVNDLILDWLHAHAGK
jgi:pimeloyl-ACP methyl ester carboxylesterase